MKNISSRKYVSLTGFILAVLYIVNALFVVVSSTQSPGGNWLFGRYFGIAILSMPFDKAFDWLFVLLGYMDFDILNSPVPQLDTGDQRWIVIFIMCAVYYVISLYLFGVGLSNIRKRKIFSIKLILILVLIPCISYSLSRIWYYRYNFYGIKREYKGNGYGLVKELHYHNGKLNGIQTQYYHRGIIICQKKYSEGKMVEIIKDDIQCSF